MTEKQIRILDNYYLGNISKQELFQTFGKEIEDVNFVKEVLKNSIISKEKIKIESALNLLWLQKELDIFIDELNKLLLEPNHFCHQVITKKIQDLKNPKSIPFIRKVLESNFDYLDYTGSESGVIAKWFSWALFSIGTKEAIDLIKEFTNSKNEGIKNEMIYRLKKTNT